ncbi:hypothetical protein F4678DRAFT_442298 [Xylaria arbuscula]|nr:hypothetical protein F4678DRAFT_442298 [Xylaria arbuscula]
MLGNYSFLHYSRYRINRYRSKPHIGYGDTGIMMDSFLFGDRSILALLVFPDTLYSTVLSSSFFYSSFCSYIYLILFILLYYILDLLYICLYCLCV